MSNGVIAGAGFTRAGRRACCNSPARSFAPKPAGCGNRHTWRCAYRPFPGLLSADDIAKAQSNWSGLCDETFLQMGTWRKDITRIARVHRDPFQAVLPVLEADSPAGVYNRIPEEILRRLPDGEKHPLAAAEAVRAFLMLRIGLHTGLRQRNLRQLRVCPVTSPPTPMDRLEAIASGELHWDSAPAGWVVTIPANAFKNGGSSCFANSPYALRLPDYGDLYVQIIAYLTVHRPLLLAEAEDPGTFFVKTVRNSHLDRAHYEEAAFYTAWRHAIERYGVYNPYILAAERSKASCRTRTMSATSWRRIFSSGRGPMSTRATRSRTPPKWWPGATRASCRTKKPRSPRGSWLKFGRAHDESVAAAEMLLYRTHLFANADLR